MWDTPFGLTEEQSNKKLKTFTFFLCEVRHKVSNEKRERKFIKYKILIVSFKKVMVALKVIKKYLESKKTINKRLWEIIL